MTPVYLDWETRSMVSIKLCSGPAYVAHGTTEVLCGAAILPDGSEWTWSPWLPSGSPLPPPAVLDAALRHGVAAHNAEGFDRLVWEALDLPPVRWLDTAKLARRRGLPGSLEGACQAALGVGKDAAGSKVMLKLSTPQRGRLLAPVPALLTAVVRYCLRDVRVMRDLAEAERLFDPHPDDPTLDLDTAVNRRGVAIDLDWIHALLAATRAHGDAALASVRAALAEAGWTPPEDAAPDADPVVTFLRSPAQLLPFLRRRAGAEAVPDCRADTMRALLGHPHPAVASTAAGRLVVARVTSGKLHRMLAQAVDGRLTHLLAYHSAHTGRWGGRGVQPQNMPGLPQGCEDATPSTALEVAARQGVPPQAVLGGLVKRSLVPSPGRLFVYLDLASVEARGVLWLAGDVEGCARFARGGAYEAMAATLFGVPVEEVTRAQRQVGKATVLACGFAGGPAALLRGALKGGLTEEALRATGIDPEVAVETWRDAHPLVAGARTGGMFERPPRPPCPGRRGGLWKALIRAAKRCAWGEASSTHGVAFEREGPHMRVTLPSGRPLLYRHVRTEPRVPPWGGEPRDTLVWTSPRGHKCMSPSVAVENVVQALCRDLFVHGMRLAEAHGLPVALHVHDGVVFEAPEAEAEEALALATACMTHVPAWAEGFPLDAEGGLLRRFE